MSQTYAVKTYEQVGEREDLTSIISTITLHETPLFSGLEHVKASGTYHEWQTDSLTTGSANNQIEGADFSFALAASRTRTGNYTQIFTKAIEVSETIRAVSVAGLEDEYAYQMEKKMKEIATDVEKALITATANSGASGTARRLKGILSWLTAYVESGSGTGTQALTEALYNSMLAEIWGNGGRPDATYVNGWQKRKISAFATSNTRYLEVDSEAKLINKVSVYESDFGVQRILLDSFMSTDTIAVLQRDMWKVAILRGISQVDVAKVADSKRGALVGELTLEAKNAASSGKIIQLTTS
ncbi:hypothetical protein A2193_00020 [Candidatus Azambacteria bacterium RIFOXYA1_FULL_42_37]|nr:MAG: hypothetical protein A2193_00020 [Candidatus Azambacteria bacterium RIFOXYA1_FULL_42_37]